MTSTIISASADLLDLGGSIGVGLIGADDTRTGLRLSLEAAAELHGELGRLLTDSLHARLLHLERLSAAGGLACRRRRPRGGKRK